MSPMVLRICKFITKSQQDILRNQHSTFESNCNLNIEILFCYIGLGNRQTKKNLGL